MAVEPNGPPLTCEEIAAITNVKVRTVRNLVNQGKIGAVRVGNAIRVERTEFNSYIAKNSTPAVS